MKLKREYLILAVCIALLAITSACLFSPPSIPGMGGGTQKMWSDVPAFEGATQDPKEALGSSLFNQAQADEKSKMETLIFHTDKKPPDVAAFYTAERMKAFGWAPEGLGASSGGCLQDKYEGSPRTMCEFKKKNEEGREINLTIDARNDEAAKNTRLIFVKITGSLITK